MKSVESGLCAGPGTLGSQIWSRVRMVESVHRFDREANCLCRVGRHEIKKNVAVVWTALLGAHNLMEFESPYRRRMAEVVVVACSS